MIGRYTVRLALWVIEFLLPRLYVHVGVRELSEIDLRALYYDARHRALNGHITQNQCRQSFRSEPVQRVHGDPVALRIDTFPVVPLSLALRVLTVFRLA